MARRATSLLAAALPGLALAACARPREARLDLLAGVSTAELRSDSLDLAWLASDPRGGERGFGALEASGIVWAVGERSRLILPFHTTGDKELRVRARCHESLGPTLPLELTLNGHRLGPLTLTPVEQELRLALPGAAQVEGENRLELSSPRRRHPRPDEADQRPLVAAFSALEVRPLGWTAPAAVPRLEAGRLLLPGHSALVYFTDVARGARLRVGLDGPASRNAQVQVAIQDDDSAERLIAGPAADGPGTVHERSLERWSGRLVRLEVANGGAHPTSLGALEIAWPDPLPRRPAAGPPLGFAPSILLYLVDTLRADRLGAYGHRAPTSPRFDAFVAEALLFEDAWAQASWTRPAVGSIFTGLYPAEHGADREDHALAPETTTLAEALRARGYRTAAFVSNHLVGGRFGFDQGFDAWNDGDDSVYGESAAALGRRALAWLDQGRDPFFLYVHTMEPHSPYDPAPEHAAPFRFPYAGSRDTRALLRLGQLGQLSEDGLRFLEAQYQGEVRQSDAAFGALVDGLRSRGRLERTLLVFTADHGEELMEHGGTEHAKTLYQELVRVPLAVRLPAARRAGTREAAAVQQIDLHPTLLRFAGVPPADGLPGRDLAALWLGGAAPAPRQPTLFADQRFTVVAKTAARQGRYKLILNADGRGLWRAGARLELYDLLSDPAERANLAASRPIAARGLELELERFRKAQAAKRRGRELTLSAREREQLRALGYVQ